MGYDMTFQTVDPDESARVMVIQEELNKLYNERDAFPKEEKGVPRDDFTDYIDKGGDPFGDEAYVGRSEAYTAILRKCDELVRQRDDAERSYFRFNIFGMSRCANLMARFGMIFDDEPHPEWPKIEEYGIGWDIRENWRYPEYRGADDPELTPEQIEACEKFEKAHDAILATHIMETPGIPDVKFSSNDSWWVLPAECLAALEIHEKGKAELIEHGGEELYVKLIESQLTIDKWNDWLRYLREAADHDGFRVR